MILHSLAAAVVLHGITFADSPNVTYVQVREASKALAIPISYSKGQVLLGGRVAHSLRRLSNGDRIVSLRELAHGRASVAFDKDSGESLLVRGSFQAKVRTGTKKVRVDKTRQLLKAYQGDLVVLKTKISSGAEGFRTPNGQFRAGPVKEVMHHSRQYHDAPMPWSIQVDRGTFLHGYQNVRGKPQSHGCIRLPMRAASWLFHWVEIGTPISISGRWRAHR